MLIRIKWLHPARILYQECLLDAGRVRATRGARGGKRGKQQARPHACKVQPSMRDSSGW